MTISLLPTEFIERFETWQNTTYAENREKYIKLSEEGQSPKSMVISCCDSRVQVTNIFNAESGEFFVHRNIANLVPPFNDDGDLHGTSAAIEYGVRFLNVEHLIIVGHSQCGGVEGAYNIHEGNFPHKTSFLHPWLAQLKPAYDKVKNAAVSKEIAITSMEKEAVLISIENLLSFPFIKSKVDSGNLKLHALWHDIKIGQIYEYRPEKEAFLPL